MHELTAAGRLAAWGGAALAGSVSLDDAADAVAGPGDAGHRVFDLSGEDGGVNLAYALGRLRGDGARGLRLVLPRPGDLTGLCGPPAFNERAVAHGAAVLTVGGPPRALLDAGRGAWTVHAVAPDPRSPMPLPEARRELARVMRQATELLLRLDVARWEPAAAEVLEHRSSREQPQPLPLSFPPEAHTVLESAQRLLAIVDAARHSDGTAITAEEMRSRAGVLRGLDAAARRGVEAACSSPVA